MSGDVPSASNLSVRRGSAPCPEAEECLKGGHRLPPAIVPKDELVKIDLQLRFTDAVVRADQPLLQIPDGPVGKLHDRRGTSAQVAWARLSPGHVRYAYGLQRLEPCQPVRVDRRPRPDVLLDELEHRGLFEVRDRHSNPARTAPPFFDGDYHNRGFAPFQLPTPSQAGLGPSEGMSRAMLEFSGGSMDILCDVLHGFTEAELLVTGT